MLFLKRSDAPPQLCQGRQGREERGAGERRDPSGRHGGERSGLGSLNRGTTGAVRGKEEGRERAGGTVKKRCRLPAGAAARTGLPGSA